MSIGKGKNDKEIMNKLLKTFLVLVVLAICYSVYLKIQLPQKLEWNRIENNKIAKAVSDTIKKQLKNRRYENIDILDSTYMGKVSLSINNNHYLIFNFDYYTIYYKERYINIMKENYKPPYVIYKDTLFCCISSIFSHDLERLEFEYYALK